MATSGTPDDGLDRDLGEQYYKGQMALEQQLTNEIVEVIRR